MGYAKQNPTWEQLSKIRQLMEQDGLSIAACSKKFKVPHGIMRRWTTDAGIVRKLPDPVPDEVILAAYLKHKTINATAKAAGVPRAEVPRAIGRLGYQRVGNRYKHVSDIPEVKPVSDYQKVIIPPQTDRFRSINMENESAKRAIQRRINDSPVRMCNDTEAHQKQLRG